MVLAVDGSRQAELADEVLRIRPGEGGVQYAAAVWHGVFQRAVVVVDVTADAVPGDGALHVQRLPADRRETAHIAAHRAATEIDGEADLPVFVVAVDDVAGVAGRAMAWHGGGGCRLQDMEMAVAVAARVEAAEGGVGEVAVEQGGTAVCPGAEGAVAAVEGVGAVAVNRCDAAAADAAFREKAHHAVAIDARRRHAKAVQAAPLRTWRRRAAVAADIAGRHEGTTADVTAVVVMVALLSVVVGVDGEAGAVDGHGNIVAAAGGEQQGGRERTESVTEAHG